MIGHTPGPWVVEGDVASLPDDIGVSIVNREHDGNDWDVALVHSSEANANLIAAAPDMLQALRMLLQAYGPSSGWSQGARDAWEAAEAAVARAEGR
jgi:hypothetical protein